MNWIVNRKKGSIGRIYQDHRILYHNHDVWGVIGQMRLRKAFQIGKGHELAQEWRPVAAQSVNTDT